MMELAKIEDVFEFVRNGASIKQEDEKGGYPITRIETIWNETIDLGRLGYADVFDRDLEKYSKYLLQEGDILMTHINSPKHLGKCAIYNGNPTKLIHGMNLLCLRAKESVSYPKFLKYYLNSKFFKDQLPKISNQSVNQASFSAGNLKKLEIPLPPLETQKKIAAILDAADAYRQKTKVLLAKYEELTQSVFLEMFGDPVRNEKGWEKEATITYCDCIVPGRDKPKSFTGNVPWITTADLKHLGYTSKSRTLIGLTNNEIKEVRAKVIPRNSVIMTCVGDLGILSINTEDMVMNQQLHAFICGDELNSVFLMYSLSYQKSYMYKMASSTTVPYMNKSIANNTPTIAPPITLQNQFADRVQKIETQKAQAQQSLEKAEELFNSLLQKAFKGELV